jgi:serine protease Do
LSGTVTTGIVSALNRAVNLGGDNPNDPSPPVLNAIQTDAAINPGNSGGPLLDMRGLVIGMNTAIYSRSGGYNGIGFAVPASLVRNIAEQLINSGHIRRGYLGVFLQPIDEELHAGLNLPAGVHGGALVARVAPGSPAAKAGVESGDVISEVNGTLMKQHSEIVNAIGLMKPGTTVGLTLYRDGKKKLVKVTIAEHPEDEDEDGKAPGKVPLEDPMDKDLPFGMALKGWSKQLQSRFGFESKTGVVVTNVEPDGPADRAGLKPGDVILKVDGKKIDGLGQLKKLAKGKSRLLVWIERAGEYYFVTLRKG